jgi:transposase-like protein
VHCAAFVPSGTESKQGLSAFSSTVWGVLFSLGISRNVLGRWRTEYREQGKQAFPGAGHQSPEAEELKRLREEVRKLKLEKEILKKAAAFFARESG